MSTVNIYYGTGENKILSNLADRPFLDKEGRKYYSVEHAYQTWKSGVFDDNTYRKYKSGGVKIRGKEAKAEAGWTTLLMKRLIKSSLEQNPNVLKILLDTGDAVITHLQGGTKWGTVFPQILMELREEMRPRNHVTKIISGGQTGVDEMGLQVGKELGLLTGGTATKGFKQEFRNKPELAGLYGMTEITDEQQKDYTSRTGKTDPYTGRTELNVRNSDGTVYFATLEDGAGKAATERAAKQFSKPFILNPSVMALQAWLESNNIEVLNVAGSRGSKITREELYHFTFVLTQALTIHNVR